MNNYIRLGLVPYVSALLAQRESRVASWALTRQRLSVKKQHGETGGGWVAAAAAGEGGGSVEAVASPGFSTCFSQRTRFCNDLWSRSSSNLAGPGQGSTALRGAGHRSAPRRKSDVVWGRRSPT